MGPENNICTTHNICLNFYSYGFLLVLVFTALVAIFLLSLRQRSTATLFLGLGFLMFVPFNAGYFLAAAYYEPAAAYHRWLTAGFILPSLIFIIQFLLRFPENSYPRFTRYSGLLLGVVATVAVINFALVTLEADYTFHFDGHYWDFDLDADSRKLALVILAFVVIFILTGIGRFIYLRTRERYALLGITFSALLAGILPGVLNALSRNGEISRSTYLLALVLLLLLAFFIISVIYINSSQERTTFMAKIVGLAMVTFLVTLQFISAFNFQKDESHYDQLQIEKGRRLINSERKDEQFEYIAEYTIADDEFSLDFPGTAPDINLEQLRSEFLNTVIYDKIRAIEPELFRPQLENLLSSAPETFGGYQIAINGFLLHSLDSGLTLKSELEQQLENWSRLATHHANMVERLPVDQFRRRLTDYLEETPEEFTPFKRAIWRKIDLEPELTGELLKSVVLSYLARLIPSETRSYRSSDTTGSLSTRHYITFIFYDPVKNSIAEIAYSYIDYRSYLHAAALIQVIILAGVVGVILFLFPLFFRGALLSPLRQLMRGVEQVNRGDFNVTLPRRVNDEIGFLTGSFNQMVESIRSAHQRLQEYAHNLEEMVSQRTHSLDKTLSEVQELKDKQDGDYFLTSLLTAPLNNNANKSNSVSTEFYIKQKKEFSFRNGQAELGGDICITGNLRLGREDSYRRYTVIVNGDAMGKSMQGAGGAIVMGVIINSFLARSARNNRIIDYTPAEWLRAVYEELQSVFFAFQGSMALSAFVGLVDDETGELFYFNADHPPSLVFRQGRAEFLKEQHHLNKIGFDTEVDFSVRNYQLLSGDVLFIGSDGRDDIDLTPDQSERTINTDENHFLRVVEKCNGVLQQIALQLQNSGQFTDDVSILRVGFQEQIIRQDKRNSTASDINVSLESAIDIDPEFETMGEVFNNYYHAGRKKMKTGDQTTAQNLLLQAYQINPDNGELNRTLGCLSFRMQNYELARETLEKYLSQNQSDEDCWLYLAIAHHKGGDLNRALEAAESAERLNPRRIPTLLELASLNLELKNFTKAEHYVELVNRQDPKNRRAAAISERLPTTARK